eukprot:3935917-Rhodomonas_salina.1
MPSCYDGCVTDMGYASTMCCPNIGAASMLCDVRYWDGYAMRGTGIGYVMRGTEIGYAGTRSSSGGSSLGDPTHLLCDARYWPTCSYPPHVQCDAPPPFSVPFSPSSPASYPLQPLPRRSDALAMSGTDIGVPTLRTCYAMPGTGYALAVRFPPIRNQEESEDELDVEGEVRYQPTVSYATSGTELAYGATGLFAMSGTELAYGATAGGRGEQIPVRQVLSPYELATRCPVLT